MRKSICSKSTKLLQTDLTFYNDCGKSIISLRIQLLLYLYGKILRIKTLPLYSASLSRKNSSTNHISPDIQNMGGGGYSDNLENDLPQNEGDESEPIIFQRYVSNMTAKTGKYARDQLFHAIYCDNNPTIVHFMYLPHHKVEATQALN